MENGHLLEDWTLIENPLAQSLFPVRRISIKNYLLNSIDSYTRAERFKLREEEFLIKYGGEKGLLEDYKKFNYNLGKSRKTANKVYSGY